MKNETERPNYTFPPLSFFFDEQKIKFVPRFESKRSFGLSRKKITTDSVAGHAYMTDRYARICLSSMSAFSQLIDLEKVSLIISWHDEGEVANGDITIEDQIKNPDLKKQKQHWEAKALYEKLGSYPLSMQKDIVTAFLAYEFAADSLDTYCSSDKQVSTPISKDSLKLITSALTARFFETVEGTIAARYLGINTSPINGISPLDYVYKNKYEPCVRNILRAISLAPADTSITGNAVNEVIGLFDHFNPLFDPEIKWS